MKLLYTILLAFFLVASGTAVKVEPIKD